MSAVVTTANAARPCVNEWKRASNGRWVNKYAVLGTPLTDYAVWEPFHSSHDKNGVYTRTHSTITHRGGVCLGDITTRTLPEELDALPPGDERIRAVRAWYAANKAEARALVMKVYASDFK